MGITCRTQHLSLIEWLTVREDVVRAMVAEYEEDMALEDDEWEEDDECTEEEDEVTAELEYAATQENS